MRSTTKWLELGSLKQQEAQIFFDDDYSIQKVMLKFGGVLVDCSDDLTEADKTMLEKEIYFEENDMDNGRCSLKANWKRYERPSIP